MAFRNQVPGPVLSESQFSGSALHGRKTKRDMCVQIDAKFFRTLKDIVAADPSRKGFVLELLPYACGLNVGNSFAWLDQRARGKESRQLVARKKDCRKM